MNIVLFKAFLPEIFLSIVILSHLLFNVKILTTLKFNYPILDTENWTQIFFILFIVLLLLFNIKIEGHFSNFGFINDNSTNFIKIFLITISLMLSKIILVAIKAQKLNYFEFFNLYLISILSMLLLISVSDLLPAYLIIEMQSLCFYVLASIKRDSAFSSEAGLKYFISGAFISGIFLFGSSIIYGCLGTLNFNNLSLLTYCALDSYSIALKNLVLIGILLITVVFLFKLGCAPFHMWVPDVYEGAPLASALIFSVLSKIAILSIFVKWILTFNGLFKEFQELLLFFGILSTIFGTLGAYIAKRVKSVLIYSSIAQVGFFVAALAIGTFEGFYFLYFFLFIYTITSLLLWGQISLLYFFQNKVDAFYKIQTSSMSISNLRHFFLKNNIWALAFIILFCSMGGIPPFPGFLTKVTILSTLIYEEPIYASLFIIISSVGVYYYIRVIKIIFFDKLSKKFSENKFQMIFNESFYDFIFIIFSIGLLFLVLVFFFPTFFSLLAQYSIIYTILPTLVI